MGLIGIALLSCFLALLGDVNGGNHEASQMKHFAAQFREIDTDSNGKLSRDEIRTWVLNDYINQSNFKIKDKDSDGQLTRDEYNQSPLSYFSLRESPEATFTQSDLNQDDVLSQAEYITGHYFPEVLSELMGNDKDGDSNIDWAEFGGYAREYGVDLPPTIEMAESPT